jgi:hypothetical protein
MGKGLELREAAKVVREAGIKRFAYSGGEDAVVYGCGDTGYGQ